MIYHLKDILVEGKFGEIELGMEFGKVISILGPPDDEHGELTEGYRGIFYGETEVFFYENLLDSFHFHRFDPRPDLGERNKFDPWIVYKNMELGEFVNHLQKEKINFQAFMWERSNEVIEIRLHEHTSAVFDASESPKFQLEQVNLAQRIPKNLVPILNLEEYL